ncbi:efflux RND transporter periplasmic adaptor subunit [Acidisoma sp.]|uniref:efflux RND transporter periplasmic adaptor subunit n=1 Tax=Acidisoma sp. TaxID=1872115 RepID=UPI003AFF90A0
MTDAPQPEPPPRRKSRIRWLIAVVLVALVGGAAGILAGRTDAQSTASSRPHKGKNAADAPIPVTLAPVKTQDVPVILTGLGTVQASNTVTISPMVTGPIVAIDFTEGQDVKAGDVLARIDPRTYQATLDQDLGKLAQDQATLAGAESDLARYEKLTASKFESAQTASDERATVQETKALVEQDQAAIEQARTNLSYCTITAPVDGRLGIRNIDLGNIVQAGTTTGIATLTTLKPIGVIFTLPQQDLPAIVDAAAQGRLPVSVDPEGDAAGPKETATLDVIDNEVDSSTGTVRFKAYFPNTDLHLWPGGFVTAHLTVKVLKGVLTVPPSAIQTGPTSSFVYVLNDDHKTVKQTNVTVGQQSDTTAVIDSGVSEGQQVVLQGASRLSDGSKVALAKPVSTAAADTAEPGHRHHHHGGATASAAQPT